MLIGSLILLSHRRMSRRFAVGDCVRVPDGRVGRVRALEGHAYRIRVQRRTSKTHQFLLLRAAELTRVACPSGWMSPDGYRRYLKPTLAKRRARERAKRQAASEEVERARPRHRMTTSATTDTKG